MTTHVERSLPQRWDAAPQPTTVQVAERAWEIYFARHPAIARVNSVAWRCTEMLGPMCWAALIVLFFWALTLGDA